jgi:hypothetical protein
MVRSNTTLVETEMPTKAPFGILSPATTLKELPASAEAGFTYTISDAGLVVKTSSVFGGGTGEETVVDNSENRQNFGFYYPFNIEASIEASSFGHSPDDLRVSAALALEMVAQKAIESEFWHGTIANSLTKDNDNRYLSQELALDVTPNAGTAVKVRYGQALLEEAIAESPLSPVGTIHAPKLIASVLQASPDGEGGLRTNLGTHVVAGSGYSHIGPDGVLAPTGRAWMYATGPVTVHLGAVDVTPDKLNQSVDTTNNAIKYYVSRSAAVTWSTTHLYAVLVDLTLDYA